MKLNHVQWKLIIENIIIKVYKIRVYISEKLNHVKWMLFIENIILKVFKNRVYISEFLHIRVLCIFDLFLRKNIVKICT